MTLTIPRRDLLRLVADVKPARTAVADVLISGEDGLTLRSEDETHGVQARLAPAEPGVDAELGPPLSVPYRRLWNTVAAMSGDVELSREASGLRLTSDGAAGEIPDRSAGGEPPVPRPIPALETFLTVEAAALWRAVAAVRRCVARDESPPALAGVHLVTRGGTLFCEGTDGFCLGVMPVALVAPVAGELDVTVRARCIGTLGRFAGDIRLGVVGDQLVVRGDHLAWAAQRCEATYPDTGKIVPPATTRGAATATVESAGLARAVRLALALTDSLRMVRLEVGRDLTVAANTGEPGASFEIRVEAEVAGPEAGVWINGDYVVAAVAGLRSERVTIRIAAEDKAVTFRSDLAGGVFMVMPMIIGADR